MLGLQSTNISELVTISGVVTRAEERQVSRHVQKSQLQLQLCVPDNCNTARFFMAMHLLGATVWVIASVTMISSLLLIQPCDTSDHTVCMSANTVHAMLSFCVDMRSIILCLCRTGLWRWSSSAKVAAQ